jgi:hypothetical protein
MKRTLVPGLLSMVAAVVVVIFPAIAVFADVGSVYPSVGLTGQLQTDNLTEYMLPPFSKPPPGNITDNFTEHMHPPFGKPPPNNDFMWRTPPLLDKDPSTDNITDNILIQKLAELLNVPQRNLVDAINKIVK